MTQAHTPGPWSWGDDYRGLYGAGQDNEVLTYSSYENMWLSYGEKREANGRLIAAAPELLAALIGVVAVADRKTDEFDAARAAIAKATGAQP